MPRPRVRRDNDPFEGARLLRVQFNEGVLAAVVGRALTRRRDVDAPPYRRGYQSVEFAYRKYFNSRIASPLLCGARELSASQTPRIAPESRRARASDGDPLTLNVRFSFADMATGQRGGTGSSGFET